MFRLGSWEVLVILFVALLIFGKRLPSIARSLGKSIRSLKDGLKEADVSEELDEGGQSAQQEEDSEGNEA